MNYLAFWYIVPVKRFKVESNPGLLCTDVPAAVNNLK